MSADNEIAVIKFKHSKDPSKLEYRVGMIFGCPSRKDVEAIVSQSNHWDFKVFNNKEEACSYADHMYEQNSYVEYGKTVYDYSLVSWDEALKICQDANKLQDLENNLEAYWEKNRS